MFQDTVSTAPEDDFFIKTHADDRFMQMEDGILGTKKHGNGPLGGFLQSFRQSTKGQVDRGLASGGSGVNIQQVTVVVKDERPEHFINKLAGALSAMKS